MNISQVSSQNGEVVLKLEVEPERLDKHISAAVRRVAQRVDIPGFRKGKAPRALLQNYVGKQYLVDEAMESLVPEAVSEAVRDQELVPFGQPRFDVTQTEPNVEIEATVPLEPSVKIGDYASIQYDDQPDEVSDDDVNSQLEMLQRSQAYAQTVDRPAEENDLVLVDLKFSADETLILDQQDRQLQLNTDADQLGEVFVNLHKGIIGLSADEDKEFAFEVSEDDASGELAGKTAHVAVKVKSVQEEILPPVDDALAATAGVPEVDTVEQLTDHIRQMLEQRAENVLINSIESKFFEDVVEKSEFAISPIVIDHEAEHILERIVRQRLIMDGRAGQRITENDFNQEDIANAKDVAERNIKNSLVVQKLVELEGVEVSDDEVNEEFLQANAAATSEEQVIEDNDENRQAIQNTLKRRRTIQKVINAARGLDDQTQ